MAVKIVDFVAEEKTNPYTDDIQALLDAGEGKAAVFEVPFEDAKKARFKIAKAANAVDKTARFRKEESDGKVTKFTITLTTRHQARRGKAADAAESAEAPKVAKG